MGSRRVYNLERDIKLTNWIVDRVRHDDVYAQNLYAAFCNHVFMPQDVWGILNNVVWHCQWRYAAGIIGEIREEPDEFWYCSGLQLINPGFVAESVITDEIENHIKKIGWIIDPPLC